MRARYILISVLGLIVFSSPGVADDASGGSELKMDCPDLVDDELKKIGCSTGSDCKLETRWKDMDEFREQNLDADAARATERRSGEFAVSEIVGSENQHKGSLRSRQMLGRRDSKFNAGKREFIFRDPKNEYKMAKEFWSPNQKERVELFFGASNLRFLGFQIRRSDAIYTHEVDSECRIVRSWKESTGGLERQPLVRVAGAFCADLNRMAALAKEADTWVKGRKAMSVADACKAAGGKPPRQIDLLARVASEKCRCIEGGAAVDPMETNCGEPSPYARMRESLRSSTRIVAYDPPTDLNDETKKLCQEFEGKWIVSKSGVSRPQERPPR